MADINTNEHGLVGDLRSEGHAPQVTTDLGIHLSDDVHENAVVVLGDSAVSHKL